MESNKSFVLLSVHHSFRDFRTDYSGATLVVHGAFQWKHGHIAQGSPQIRLHAFTTDSMVAFESKRAGLAVTYTTFLFPKEQIPKLV